MGDKLTHINEDGEVHMVDVGAKNVTQRQAVATSRISMSKAAFDAVKSGNLKKKAMHWVSRELRALCRRKTRHR